MIREVGRRLRSLSHHDRLLLLLPAAWSAIAFVDNYFRLRSAAYRASGIQLLLVIVLCSSVAGFLAWSVFRGQRRLADYGFTFGRGGLGSLAALSVLHVYLAMTGKLVLQAPEGFLWAILALAAFAEEVVFRVIAIVAFILLLDRVKGKAFWAILAGSALFSAYHIPSKSPLQLQGIFISSLILSYVYYKTRSVLLPAWLHAATNTGFAGGVLAVALYCAAAAASRITSGEVKPARSRTAASTNR
ncbi:MAG: CPBP family intramembrane metalloprotease [Bryobacterales bacterium]|nr:CPBP family intramembrane metalloprotease [Bryobacterales bacterium]